MHIDSVCDLASDPGLVGRALSRIPLELRREADRWDDPWEFLLGVRESYMSKGLRQLFGAAQTQRSALRQLARILVGADKLTISWCAIMKRASWVPDKVFDGYWRFDRGKYFLSETEREPELASGMRLVLRSYYGQLRTAAAARTEIQRRIALCERKARKLRRKHGVKAEELLRPTKITERSPFMLQVGARLIQRWMRNPKSMPGYCFFGDQALLAVMQVDAYRSLEMDTLRKVRRLFGLKKAPIFVYGTQINSSGKWELLDRRGRTIRIGTPR
jgi:hypothetical protein